MAPERFLDRLHASARRIPALYRLAVVSRLLLAIAFLPPGLVKLTGQRFTSLGTDQPIGAFFEAMYQTGLYWNFLGLGQVMAAVLLLVPATSTLGAVIFLPIIINVTVITWSIGFAGTVYITSLMLVANVFLLCWDYDRLRAILFAPAARPVPPVRLPMPLIERAGYAVGGVAGLGVFMATRSFLPMSAVRWFLAVGAAGALMVLIAWITPGSTGRTPPVGSR